MEKYSFLLKYQCFSLSVYGFKCFAVCAGADCGDVQECKDVFEVVRFAPLFRLYALAFLIARAHVECFGGSQCRP